MVNTTLCYIEKDNSYLMLHRTKKPNDYNHDKWIGIGGKFENGESPEECAVREIFEETGLCVKKENLEYFGIVTFLDLAENNEDISKSYTEFMHIFRSKIFSGTVNLSCDEGELEWVPINKMNNLPHWKGDEIFLDLISKNSPFFSLKLTYKKGELLDAVLNGKKFDF